MYFFFLIVVFVCLCFFLSLDNVCLVFSSFFWKYKLKVKFFVMVEERVRSKDVSRGKGRLVRFIDSKLK